MTFEETKRLLELNGLRAITLRDREGAGCLLISPDLSARIMAVSMNGPGGENFGFVKPEAIAHRGEDPQFNAYGGALRWWIGPEGGQYGVAFPVGTTQFDLASWHISEEYNGKSFAVSYPETEGTSALMGAEARVTSAAGTRFHLGVTSRIVLLDDSVAKASARGNKSARKLKHFGYRSELTFENLSEMPMRKETGLVSIWMLGMYVAGPRTHVLVPFERSGTGAIVTDTYFSPDGVAADRLRVYERAGYLAFRADARERAKIGLSRSRASSVIGSIDLARNLLTVWRFPIRRRAPYVNSLWEVQKQPYAGDASNSYNDDGNFGPFYELECSSQALSLAPGERFCFPLDIHHYTGEKTTLFQVAEKLLGRKIKWDEL